MHKVQLTLSPEEVQVLQMKADRLGYGITKYIKFLVSQEVVSTMDDHPVIQLSKKAIKRFDQAMKEHEAGESILLNDVNDLDKL